MNEMRRTRLRGWPAQPDVACDLEMRLSRLRDRMVKERRYSDAAALDRAIAREKALAAKDGG